MLLFSLRRPGEHFPLLILILILILIPLPILSLSSLKAVVEVFNTGCGLYLFTLSPEGQPAGRNPGPGQTLAKKSPAWRGRPPARQPRHEFRIPLLRHRRRQPFQ